MRKPNTDIFEYVFHDAGISPAETLFIDDFIENIETAGKLGMKVFHLKAPFTLADLFENESR
jgi:putative hydrolase of the HAD superfamily